MDTILKAMTLHPGRTIVSIMTINTVLFIGAVAAIAIGVRYALTGHI